MVKLDKMLDMVMRVIMAFTMFILLAAGTWQIFSRWILRDPSTFTDELLRYLLVWAAMIGSAYCFYKNEHLALDLVKDKVKGIAKIILTVFIEAAIIFFVSYVFIFGGFRISVFATNASSVMRIPFKILYSILPISGVLIIIGRVLSYIQMITAKKGEK